MTALMSSAWCAKKCIQRHCGCLTDYRQRFALAMSFKLGAYMQGDWHT